MKDCSFYASLRTKPALIENNTTKDNENGDSNAIANNEVDTDKEFRFVLTLSYYCIIAISSEKIKFYINFALLISIMLVNRMIRK